jgi:multicomponent Na+:H+ antiporter subunit E
VRIVSLVLVLCAFWLASSGRTGRLPLTLMAASAAVVSALAHRLRLVDAHRSRRPQPKGSMSSLRDDQERAAGAVDTWSGPQPRGSHVLTHSPDARAPHPPGGLGSRGHPVHLLPRALRYGAWLVRQVVLSNLAVVRIIFSPRAWHDARVVRVPISQPDAMGRAVLANSVTLTPGTATIAVEEHALVVHCLTGAIASELAGGEFDRRVTAFAGRRT